MNAETRRDFLHGIIAAAIILNGLGKRPTLGAKGFRSLQIGLSRREKISSRWSPRDVTW